ncbi:RNA ligase [Streptosporangium sp. NPDC051022]|uniref:RNA ligase n=1 Tax=Streptosporangium sp. NPDC051022 TaxID=3155752 RepID=UPI0034388FE5
MVKLHVAELLDLECLEEAINTGFVRAQNHPVEPLVIYNYTEKTQYEGEWNRVTQTCRGLIADGSGTIVARPFAKFFNYGDPMAGELDLSAKVVVADKMDGSLGILYPTASGDYAVATRGSFASEQAQHATDVLRSRYSDFSPPEGVTVLFEIIYPANRIVCEYGGADDLFLLGGVEISTGRVLGPDEVPAWSGPRAAVFSAPMLADALAMPPRPGAEGLVVRLVDTGQMVKIKQADYVALHKIITGLNARGVWEALGEGKTISDICEPLPDEFHQWVRDLAEGLQLRAAMAYGAVQATHNNIVDKLDHKHPDGWQRQDYATWATQCTNPAWLFNLLDDRDPRPAIWKTLRPSGDIRPVALSEDAA